MNEVPRLSHVAPDGSVAMVDVANKPYSSRRARAEAFVHLGSDAARALREATLAKGDALTAAQLAGIMAAKRTPDLIPLAHPLASLTLDVTFDWSGDVLRIEAMAHAHAQTGVEMEALVAAAAAALTIYDMCKALDKGIVIERIALIEKSGGKSGDWQRV